MTIHTYIHTLVCRCHVVFLWCYVCFILFHFRLYIFIEAAALRSIVLRYARPTSQARTRTQGNIHFSCSADYEQDWQPYPVDPYSCYMCDHTCRRPDSHTCFSLFSFCFFGDVAFSEYFLYHYHLLPFYLFVLLIVWRVRRTSFPSGWCFSTLSPRAEFFTSSAHTCENSINQSKRVNSI